MVFALGVLAVCALAIAGAGLIGFSIYRFVTRSLCAEGVDRNGDWKVWGVNAKGETQPRSQTAPELIEHLRSIDWFQFEQLVALAYRKQGCAVSRRGGANPDSGIDLVLEKDGTRTAVQCRHWKTWNVGVKAVREFLGALTDAGIQRGLFITLGGCTGDAKRLVDKHGIEVVNEAGLARMLEATDARFDRAALEILPDTRKLCPQCERKMVPRTASVRSGALEFEKK
jgi:restriction system protein